YGTKGFITIRKGGDASVFRVGQAVATGWTNGTTFQNAVGFKVGVPLEIRLLTILLPPAQACCNSPDLFTISELGSFSLINRKRPASAGRFCFSEIDFTG